MNSKNAELFINKIHHANGVLWRDEAKKAIELAEQEMREKAIESFKEILNGFNLYRTEQNTAINDFIIKLDN